MSLQAELLEACLPSYAHTFRKRVERTPDAVAYLVPPPQDVGPWQELSWRQTREVVDELAAGLIACGIQPGERVSIACTTRIEWVQIDLGIACAAAATTTVYPSTDVADVTHILVDSGALIHVAENSAQLDKVLGDPQLDAQLRHIILIDDDRAEALEDPRIVVWSDLRERGRRQLAEHPDCVDQRIALLGPDSLSTLIYTSGTTGRPKGVELRHRAWTYQGVAVEWLDIIEASEILYLWLPLSHVFGRDLLSAQMQIGFTAAVDGRVDKIIDGLGQVRPQFMVGVPRIFEKVRAAVITMNPTSGVKSRIARWAFAVGRESRSHRIAGHPMPVGLQVRYAIADRLVFSKLKARLGGRMRLMISGSAKLSSQVQEWFYSAGLLLIEGYGLTETAAIVSVDDPSRPHFGTVGRLLPGIEARIAADGEIQLRGPIVTSGYHNLPEANAEAFTADGWFCTGDIGSLDAEGFLTITDRKKDLLKTSNGKYVAPQKVESAIMANIPYISHALAVGEAHKYVGALIALDPVALRKWAANHGHEEADYAELSQLPEIRRSIDRFMRRANEHLEHWEQVRKYVICQREFSMDADELTPSLKVRRNVVLHNFADEYESIYAENSPVPFLEDKRPKRRRSRRQEGSTGQSAAAAEDTDPPSAEAAEAGQDKE